jgi:hypothetical protein
VVGFAIFHTVIFQKRKKALLHGMWKLVGTRWNRWAMVCERKSGEECQALKKSTNVLVSLKICLVWKIVRTPLPVIDKEQPPLKTICISVLQIIKIPGSLCKGPFFYFMLSLHILTLSTFLRAWLSFLVQCACPRTRLIVV